MAGNSDSSKPGTDCPHVVIVGAGLTGLSAAHSLVKEFQRSGQPFRATVLESSDRAGGVIQTIHEADCLIERGADSFITNKPYAVDLCRELGLESELLPTNSEWRRSLVLKDGTTQEVPPGFQLMVPTQFGPFLKSPILSLSGRLRCLAEQYLPPRTTGEDESLAQFVRRRFGSEALDCLIQPLVGGIYTADPEKLSLRATLHRFPDMEQQHGSVIKAARAAIRDANATADSQAEVASGARYGLFLTLRNGMTQLIDRLQQSVAQHADIQFGENVTGIRKAGEQSWQVETGDRVLTCDGVILTTPAWRSSELVANIHPHLSSTLSQIEYASSAVVASVHDLDSFDHALDAFGLVIPARERRKILAVSFSSRKFPNRAPDGQVLLRTFMGGALQPEISHLSDDELLKVHHSELTDILGMRAAARHTVITRYTRAMPQYLIGHLDRVAEIDNAISQLQGFELAGSSLKGVGIPDCINSGQRAARQVFSEIAS